jgi:hypothetical protein
LSIWLIWSWSFWIIIVDEVKWSNFCGKFWSKWSNKSYNWSVWNCVCSEDWTTGRDGNCRFAIEFVLAFPCDVNERGKWQCLNNKIFDEACGNGLFGEEWTISVPSNRRAFGVNKVCVNEWFNDDVEEFNISVFSNDSEWGWSINDSIWFIWLSMKDIFTNWTLDKSWISSSWKTEVINSYVVSFGVDVIGLVDIVGKILDGLGYKKFMKLSRIIYIVVYDYR